MKQENGKVRYGIDNPHPLSQLTTELVWEGKYDEYGNRREVDIAGSAMPMQKIETIDEPRSRDSEKSAAFAHQHRAKPAICLNLGRNEKPFTLSQHGRASVVFSVPQPHNLFVGLGLGVFVYLFSLVFLLAAWHGFRFFRSFFRNREGDSQ